MSYLAGDPEAVPHAELARQLRLAESTLRRLQWSPNQSLLAAVTETQVCLLRCTKGILSAEYAPSGDISNAGLGQVRTDLPHRDAPLTQTPDFDFGDIFVDD